jgi:hypothetical protein
MPYIARNAFLIMCRLLNFYKGVLRNGLSNYTT